jgi:ADP-heptose:LPS heptosyltransferase
MSILKQLWRKYGINPFDALLKKAAKQKDQRFLICWNRGLGDIPLGLYALTLRIRQHIDNADITFVTRSDLLEGFQLLEGVRAICDPEWKRGQAIDLDKTFLNTGLCRSDFDVVIERPDPTHWLMWQLGKIVPQLKWDEEWDQLSAKFGLDPNKKYVGVHVQTETNYAYEKNWPVEYWQEFFKQARLKHGAEIILFGFAPHPMFEGEGIVDLRGKTTLFEMLAIIKNRCSYLLVPDSGVLSIVYYINAAFPIEIVSLWADPKQGVLKQNVASPNPLLRHRPLIAKNKDLRTVDVTSALQALFGGVHETAN